MKKHYLFIALISTLFLPTSVIATTATITSTNLLNSIENIKSIDEIEYTISDLPSGTSGSLQFSTDGTNWKNKSNSTGSETLTTGTNKIPLTNFGTSASFYYQLSLYTPDDSLPLVDSIDLKYTTTNNDLFSWNPWSPTTNETQISAIDNDSSNWTNPDSGFSTPTISNESVVKTTGSGSLKLSTTTDGVNNDINRPFTSANLSDVNTFQFDIAADNLGSYIQTVIGENNNYANYLSDSNTVALWHFDNGSLVDSSSNNLTLVNTETLTASGKLESGRYFDGINDQLKSSSSVWSGLIPNGSAQSFTMDAWIKPDSYYDNQVILGQKTGRSFVLMLDTAGKLKFNFDDGTYRLSTGSIVANQWNHVAITYDGVTKNGTLYINGVSSGGGTNDDTALDEVTAYMYIGWQDRGVGTVGNYFKGLMDEVRVSNIVRSSSDILQAYEIGKRTHTVTIDFSASLGKNSSVSDPENLISNSSDLTFYIDEKPYGSSGIANHLFIGDKVVVKEGSDIAQGTVQSVSPTTGLVEVLSWESGSTFPVGGYTTSATLFKWQTEYVNLNSLTDSNIDAVTNFILKINGSTSAKTIYLDNLRYTTGYLSDYTSSAFNLPPNNQFIQYRAILTSSDNLNSPSFSDISIGYESNAPDIPTISTVSATANSLTWTITDDVSAKATSFNIYDLSNVAKATASGTTSVDIVETGLAPNTQYTRKAYGWNSYGRSQKSTEYSKYTLAAVPDLTFTRDDYLATVSAAVNNNPSNTKYSIVLNSGTLTECNLNPDSLTLSDPYYVNQSGNLTTLETSKGWFTSDELSSLVISGLSNTSVYSICLKARNQELIETDYSAAYSNNGDYRSILGDIIVEEGQGNSVGFANKYQDCNDPSRVIFGNDSLNTSLNTSKLELKSGVLTLQSNESLITGELIIGDNTSIAIGEPVATVSGIVNGAQIILGGRITQTDADGDGYPEDPNTVCFFEKSNTVIDPTFTLIGQMPNKDIADCNDQLDTVNTVCTSVYLDADGDGNGSGVATSSCEPDPITGLCEYNGNQYVTNNSDCNDSESTLSTLLSCYLDSDGDEYGSGSVGSYCVETGVSCQGTATYSAPTNGAVVNTGELSSLNTDCYESNANAHPGSTTCSATDRGDGSYDYNCSETETACGTSYPLISESFSHEACSGRKCRNYSKTRYVTGSVSCGSTGYICTGNSTYCSDCDVSGGVCSCSKTTSYCNSANSGTQACQ